MKKISIILLNYNGYDDTIACIESLKKNTNNLNYEIIVVDNDSTDDSFQKLSNVDGITLLDSGNNGGFSYGNNVGIKFAIDNGADYIYLLNNDTIVNDNTISNLYEVMETSDIDILGSRIMYYDNQDLIQYLGGTINWNKVTAIHNYEREKYDFQIDNIIETDFITGCSMFIKRNVFEKIGLLPEEYFMYCEDLDFCIKAKESNLKLAVCTNSVVYHKVSSSSGGENTPFSLKWGNRNRYIIMNKYKKYTNFYTKIIFYLTRYILIVKYFIKGEKDKAKAIKTGIKLGKEYVKGYKKFDKKV